MAQTRGDRSGINANINIPKDAPEGAYEILVPRGGFTIAAANGRVPMVLYAPDYWRPAPRQTPPIKWYFNVPTNSENAQILFEAGTRLYDPDGNGPGGCPRASQAKVDKALTGWIDLPADKPGLWAFEPLTNGLIGVRNIPPFFAARDPKSYFEPPIPWQKEKPYRPPEKPATGTVYVAGAVQMPGNQALYLDGKRSFVMKGGLPFGLSTGALAKAEATNAVRAQEGLPVIASPQAMQAGLPPVVPSAKGLGTEGGDGLQFLPFKQGTIEFFFKPMWSTFDLPPDSAKQFVRMEVPRGRLGMLLITRSLTRARSTGSAPMFFFRYFMTDGPERRGSIRTYRQTIIPGNEWMHVAWVWGEVAVVTGRGTIKSITMKIYINGKSGKQFPFGWRGQHPADMPRELLLGPTIDAAYDELRISDTQRYADDFAPPSRDRELAVDEHTRALFHFNGNAQGESYGKDNPIPVSAEIKE